MSKIPLIYPYHLKDLDIVVNCTLMWVPLIGELDESHVKGPDDNMGKIVFGTVFLRARNNAWFATCEPNKGLCVIN